ncbi:MAG: hypothetical protein ACXWV5_05220 [Flavitalea sp.]
MNWIKQFIKYTLIFYAIIALVYWIFIRPVHLSWGAKAAQQQIFPADELISPNRVVTTRAIDIRASKEKIWPWIAQIGQNRGGFYSYYWLENLFAAKMNNADSIVQQWQNPQPGDTVYYGEGEGYELISFVKRNEYYSLGGWTFYLDSIHADNTKLIVRYPSMEVKQSRVMQLYYYGLFEPLHFIMESGMMMGIKQKAEEK